jgi:beta-fructofuranosidase
MNWEDVNLKHGENQYRSLGTFFAPESMLTPDGRRVMWAWLFPANERLQHGVQSLPRELRLSDSNTLLIKPLQELTELRYDPKSYSDLLVKNQVDHPLAEMTGDALEIELVIEPLNTTYEINQDHVWHIPQSYGIEVLCDENGGNGVPITVFPARKTLSIAGVTAPLNIPVDQETVLRVFIDKGIIEVFANDTQAMAYAHKRSHPHAYHQLFSYQGDIAVKSVRSWKMRSAWEEQK